MCKEFQKFEFDCQKLKNNNVITFAYEMLLKRCFTFCFGRYTTSQKICGSLTPSFLLQAISEKLGYKNRCSQKAGPLLPKISTLYKDSPQFVRFDFHKWNIGSSREQVVTIISIPILNLERYEVNHPKFVPKTIKPISGRNPRYEFL